jgi:hypothetical protein
MSVPGSRVAKAVADRFFNRENVRHRSHPASSRPTSRRPYAVSSRVGKVADAIHHQGRWRHQDPGSRQRLAGTMR